MGSNAATCVVEFDPKLSEFMLIVWSAVLFDSVATKVPDPSSLETITAFSTSTSPSLLLVPLETVFSRSVA